MRHIRLTTTLVAIPLVVAGCGTATSSAPVNPGGPVTSAAPQTATSYAAALLARVNLPAGATESSIAPSKALEHVPEMASLSGQPTVLKKFWTVNQSASAVYAWLKQHGANLKVNGSGGDDPALLRYLSYSPVALPGTIAVGDVYVSVIPMGPSTSAVAAYAVALAQPPRPAAEQVPLDVSKAVIGWSIAPGGTPVLKTLTGSDATVLARDFDALEVSPLGMVSCPMTSGDEITVTFTGDGHTWRVEVPACPGISVSRDGQSLPALGFGKAFLDDIKSWTGRLPQSGPPHASGGVTPLTMVPTGR